jgi:hypothetical protein
MQWIISVDGIVDFMVDESCAVFNANSFVAHAA